ncbi:MAG: FtsW/RodA/SpoVE family cell cycle protein, partial [Paludibacteraceae bacterium]|nr:FtsW/RodA/SpoVE family cell cycle protein [Paludibacteraceae bacterium]
MRDFLKSVFKGNPALWAVIFILITISVVLMFSAISSVAYKYTNYLDPFYGHVKHLVFGVTAMLIMSRIPYRILRRLYVVLLPITVIVLFITPYIGVTLNGGTRAIRIAGFDVQPQEFAKLFVIMFLADILSVYQQNSTRTDISEDERKANEKTYFWMILAVVAITILPIAVQNFSTA